MTPDSAPKWPDHLHVKLVFIKMNTGIVEFEDYVYVLLTVLNVWRHPDNGSSAWCLILHCLSWTHSITFTSLQHLLVYVFCPSHERGREGKKKVHWKAAVCLPAAISCQNKCAAVMSSINMMDGICGAADLTTRARGARSTGSLQIYSPQREISPSLSHTHPHPARQEMRHNLLNPNPPLLQVSLVTCFGEKWQRGQDFTVLPAHRCMKIWMAAIWELWSKAEN